MASIADQKIIPADPSRVLKVIGSGFSRTGTVSFAIALGILLKGPVCHSGTACISREESFIKNWISILSADPVTDEAKITGTLRSLLAGYVGVADCPAVLFSGELAALYPDAVVICTTRDPDRWFQSFRVIGKMSMLWWLDLVFLPMPTLRYLGQWIQALRHRQEALYNYPSGKKFSPGTLPFLSQSFPSSHSDEPLHSLLTRKPASQDHLHKHSDYLKRVVPAPRLHFFDVKDGWAPLCKILDCPIPDEPFPHANDQATVREFMGSLIRASLLRWIQIFAAAAILIGLSAWFLF